MAVYTNIPPASSTSTLTVDADSVSYFTSLFQYKTGLNPMSYSTYYDDFVFNQRATTGNAGAGFFVVGANGSAAVFHSGGDAGVVTMTSGVTGAGFCDWSPSLGGAFYHIPSLRQKRWLIAYRMACGHATAAGSRVAAGAFAGTTFVGIGYGSAATNWQYCRGTAMNNITDSGHVIDTSGNVYIWVYTFNDGTNVRFCVDVENGGVETIGEQSANLPSNAGYFYLANEGASTSDIINLDAVVSCCER